MKQSLPIRVHQEIEGYKILSKDPNDLAGSIATPMNEGGSSSVYKALFKGKLLRAMKILNPAAAVDEVPGGMESFTRSFEREVGLLSQINHTNIAPVADFGETDIGGSRRPYLVTPWVEGRRIDKQLVDGDYDADTVLRVLGQVFDGVAHLHQREVLHADLDAKNIFLPYDQRAATPVILDLGVSKVLKPGLLGGKNWTTPDRPGYETQLIDELPNSTYFFTTKRICPDVWLEKLVGKRVERTVIVNIFPQYDLYGLGILLRDLFAEDSMRSRLIDGLGRSGLVGLEMLATRLMSLRDDYDITHAREDIEKLSPQYVAPFGVVELSIASPLSRSVSTANGLTAITANLDSVLGHPLVQRLKDIPQLEFVDRTYQGATQSRLAHAISTFSWARLYIAHLLADARFRMEVRRTELQAAMLWALLHDLGHYPLSHMFEDIAEELRGADGSLSIPNDDDLFWMMMDPNRRRSHQDGGEIAEAIQRAWAREEEHFAPRYRLSLRKHIEELYGVDVYTDMLNIGGYLSRRRGEPVTTAAVLAGMISSPVDADKLAYLIDDSTYTGVAFGGGVDAYGLMASLRMPPKGVTDAPVPVIGIEAAGQAAAESLVLARHWMVRRVYWHRTNRAIMAMVKHVIIRLRRAQVFSFPDFFQANMFTNRESALVYLTRELRSHRELVESLAGGQVIDTTRMLLTGHADRYFRALTISQSVDAELFDKLESLTSTRLQEVADDLTKWLRDNQGVSIHYGELLIDAPRKNRAGIAGQGGGQCFIIDEGEVDLAEKLERRSLTISGMDSARVKKARVFLHPRLREDSWANDEEVLRGLRQQLATKANPSRSD